MAIYLLTVGCKKEYTEEDFVNTLKGEWSVYSFMSEITIHLRGDTVFYYKDDIEMIYFIYDTTICALAGIENMGNWTITEKNDTLQLQTEDLCGDNKNYSIEFSNLYHYDESYGILGKPEGVIADVEISNGDKVITLSDFYIEFQDTSTWMVFTVNETEMSGRYTICR